MHNNIGWTENTKTERQHEPPVTCGRNCIRLIHILLTYIIMQHLRLKMESITSEPVQICQGLHASLSNLCHIAHAIRWASFAQWLKRHSNDIC